MLSLALIKKKLPYPLRRDSSSEIPVGGNSGTGKEAGGNIRIGFKSMTARRFLLVYSCHLDLWRRTWFLISRPLPAELVVQLHRVSTSELHRVSTSELSPPLHVWPADTVRGRLWR